MLAPVAAADDIVSFISPSGNIGCYLMSDLARCDIAQRDWEPPPRPANCPSMTGYGQGVQVSASGPAEIVCAGDTAINTAGPVLAYGQSVSAGSLTCSSAVEGVTCKNSAGHGFFISRGSYSLT